MIEQEYNLYLSDLRIITIALDHYRQTIYDTNAEHIDQLAELINKVERSYTADREVKFMVFKDE